MLKSQGWGRGWVLVSYITYTYVPEILFLMQLLRKQSDWFHSLRLTARCFIAWKHAVIAREVEKQKSSLALWHWCLNLHRKVCKFNFSEWFVSYIE